MSRHLGPAVRGALSWRLSVRLLPVAIMTVVSFAVTFTTSAAAAPSGSGGNTDRNADVTGVVTDSTTHEPLASAEVSVMRGSQIIFNASTDAFGRYTAHDITPGSYTITARFIGFRPQSRNVVIGGSAATVRIDFALAPAATNLSAVSITAAVSLVVDTRTGDQRFKQEQYHGAPTNTTSQILQQSIAGAARAPTGEVHIRGQHAEYTYYVDGVPVPAGISGSLNELFDPSVVNQIDFKTGAWDAEYGN